MRFPSLCTCSKEKNTDEEVEEGQRIKVTGTVVLVKKSVLDFNDFVPSMLDGVQELLNNHKSVSFRLVSSTYIHPNNPKRGVTGEPAYLKDWVKNALPKLAIGDSTFKVEFEWDKKHGVPGAVIVKNKHHFEFYLKSISLDDVPGKEPNQPIHFVCNSWIYPAKKYKYDRVFFSNDTYLPSQMPEALKPYREEELISLRGDNVLGKLKEHDRIYGYDFYNDLGDPKDEELKRPVLGGSQEYPYPRRGRTNRKPTKKDPKSESRIPLLLSTNIYVPRDERFGYLKMSDFYAYALKAFGQAMVPTLKTKFNKNASFESFKDTYELYEGGINLPNSKHLEKLRKKIPFQLIKEFLQTDEAELLRLPLPEVLQADKSAWRTDEEFAREMLAGLNPVVIRRLEEFPPTSKLDPSVYGNQNSTIKSEQVEKYMETLSGEKLSVNEALERNRLFILDHHDTFMPWLPKLNSLDRKNMFIYATRTILFLNDDSTLRPLAIELSWPCDDILQHGAMSQVYLPASEGTVEGSIWQLAKAYVAVNDSGYHQLISHWLNTHAVIEPFVIATNRQLSVTHPIHKLLSPHYRDTMNINALARQTLINAGGIFESTVFPGKYALEMSSGIYRNWKLTEQGLPDDLLKRGIAVKDESCKHNLRLLIEDYPYAVDGLAIWSAIEWWVNDYCSIFYSNDSMIQSDTELQAWWKEIREVGHGDLKNEKWWPNMHTVQELTKTCTTVIWVASALHAAVNFGQYSYAGYLPNRPTISRQPMPEPGTEMYDELTTDFEKVFLKTITSQLQTILGISLIEILSRHSSDEVYLGQRDTKEWTFDRQELSAFEQFKHRLEVIEKNILEMNDNEMLKNRNGPVKMPYMLLYPNTSNERSHEGGLTVKGIPNSVSI